MMPTSSDSNYPPHKPSPSVLREEGIEYGFIGKLQGLKYEYRKDIRNRAALEKNFREKFEALNRLRLTDGEFARLLDEIVTPDVFTAAKLLRQISAFTRDDGTPLNYTLVNIKDWCKNSFEVINQLRISTDNSHHRYDVIILINGVPCVQIELKTLSVNPRRAMEQIVDYKNDPGNGYTKTLLCFLQLFIVSNRDSTYYFANNNARHFAFNADERFLPIYQFADEANKKITHLDDFAATFLVKCALGQTLSRYMVLIASEQKLLMMRPYQVYAVKHLVKCIHENSGNGFIWHTTGSGKTLTSFKASTLLKDNPEIVKCLFVVDRKDLDRQTREEFNRFQEGCVEENTNTAALVRRLLSEDYADKVIVTTIQKLGLALDETSKRNKQRKKNDQPTYKALLEPLRDRRIALIFDECHRSQFGDNHKAIKAFFPKSQLFGFTGTPIFDENAAQQKIEAEQASMKTTADLFQKQLHAYTITHAIEDGNVLRFHIDYFKPKAEKNQKAPKPGEGIAKRAAIEAILAKHDTATGGRRFNALLATASINDAIEYHTLFKTMQAEKQAADPDYKPLNIAAVFSPPAEGDPDVQQIQEDLPQEQADNEEDPEGKKAALKAILADYNGRYGTNHRISEFDLYYQDVQQRIKDQQWPNADYPAAQKIDITIVVDMLLTGFDSKYLNTLYVDKNLKHHGLIQAFSRTNRVLNSTKPYGNILDFRQQQEAVDAAIALFSGEKTSQQAREIWLVDKAPVVIQKLEAAVQKLDSFMKSQGLDTAPEAVPNLKGDAARAAFINHFKEVQRLKTQLDQYTDLTEENTAAIEQILPKENLLGFRGQYLETAQRLKAEQGKGATPPSPEVEQLEFEFVLFASAVIDYDYIMGLLSNFSQQGPGKQKMSREQLMGLIQSDAKFMNNPLLTEAALQERIDLGEHTRQQFKRHFHNPDALAAELAAFANSGGGQLLIGVDDDGTIAGLSAADIRQLNQMLSNVSSQHVRPPIHPLTENVQTHAGLVMVVTVPNGLAKPYLDHQGRIWVKQGADKRHVTAREELQRMFQRGGLVYADAVPVVGTTSADIDEPAFRRYLAQHYSTDPALAELPLDALLQNLGLGDGLELSLTGLLLFGRNPLRWRPAFTIKAVAFPGTRITDTRYLDSQDISGTLPQQYTEALAFIKRNLHRVQGEQGFNSPGILEVPEITLQELLVNALVHRDYFTSASIRILVFTDRIDLISPGHLPDSLSIDDIRHGKSNRRNPTLSEHAFRLLPYRGLGSGIPRALDEWPHIELIDEVSGNQFTARVQRPKVQWEDATEQVTDPVADPVTDPVIRLLHTLVEGPLAPSDIQRMLTLKHRPTFKANYLRPALAHRWIEPTLPDKPNSRLQQYRLTEKGRALLK